MLITKSYWSNWITVPATDVADGSMDGLLMALLMTVAPWG